MCFPFCHKWEPIGADQKRDVSFGYPGTQRTDLLMCCTRCLKVKVRSIRGWWTLADLGRDGR